MCFLSYSSPIPSNWLACPYWIQLPATCKAVIILITLQYLKPSSGYTMTHLLVWPEAFYVFQLNQNSYDEQRSSNEFLLESVPEDVFRIVLDQFLVYEELGQSINPFVLLLVIGVCCNHISSQSPPMCATASTSSNSKNGEILNCI